MQEGEAKNVDLELAKVREELKRAQEEAIGARKEVAQIEAIAMEVASNPSRSFGFGVWALGLSCKDL